jgi:3-oxoacyl-[acyl-carrier protein] reductase
MTRRMLVTGATRGLGRYLAQYYLARGDLVVGCGRSESTLDSERYTHHRLDIAEEGAVRGLLAEIRARWGGLDVLINNAGVASMNAFALTPVASLRRVIDTNLLGPAMLTHGAIRLLRHSSAGRIVNVTTIAVPLRLQGEAVYAASKAGLEIFTRILAKEVGSMGITCNAVGPSVMRTALTAGVPTEKLDRLVKNQAMARDATPGDVANVVDFFLRPESTMITGQIVYLGGHG